MAFLIPEGRTRCGSFALRAIGPSVLALCALASSSCARSRPNAKITINCIPQSPSTFACTATSAGPEPARPCWDVIVTCGGVEHEAEKQCSRKLSSGNSEVVVVALGAFKPPIQPDNADCKGLRVDEISIE